MLPVGHRHSTVVFFPSLFMDEAALFLAYFMILFIAVILLLFVYRIEGIDRQISSIRLHTEREHSRIHRQHWRLIAAIARAHRRIGLATVQRHGRAS